MQFQNRRGGIMNIKYHAICALLIGTSFAAVAKQHKSGHPNIAYVSVNEAAVKTGEQKKIQLEMEKERARIEKTIRNKNNQYKKQVDKIKESLALLSEREKAKQYEKLQRMQLSMEQFIKEKDIAFQKKEADLKNKFINRIKMVIANVAQKEKVSIIRNKDTVLWVQPKWDVTNKVVVAYKKKYKNR